MVARFTSSRSTITRPRRGQHFAFAVEDLDAVRESLTDAGVKVSKPFEIPGVCRQSFCKDPAGNLLEFNQQLTSA